MMLGKIIFYNLFLNREFASKFEDLSVPEKQLLLYFLQKAIWLFFVFPKNTLRIMWVAHMISWTFYNLGEFLGIKIE